MAFHTLKNEHMPCIIRMSRIILENNQFIFSWRDAAKLIIMIFDKFTRFIDCDGAHKYSGKYLNVSKYRVCLFFIIFVQTHSSSRACNILYQVFSAGVKNTPSQSQL